MTLSTWVPVPAGSPFGPDALPYGVFSVGDEPARVGARIGDHLLDLAPLAAEDMLAVGAALAEPTLNAFMAAGPAVWAEVRAWVVDVVTAEGRREQAAPHLLPLDAVTLHMPFRVGDYVDFYSSEHHATNVGRLFRPDSEPLLPNWKHLPVGYHGRAGTVVPSGTDIVRPCGQRKPRGADAPDYGPSRQLDIEAEVGFVVGVPTTLGDRVGVADAGQHLFGVCLVNDWSARDLQSWEYVPLGPFLGKSFATSVSHWVLPVAALDHARVSPPERSHGLLDYLADEPDDPWGLDLDLEVSWNGTTVSRPPFAQMYWTAAQQLAHLTVNGASLRTGDLFASGTVSGPEPAQRGSFLELSWNGTEPVQLDDGTSRTFLEDGDEVVLTATAAGADGSRVGLGEVRGRVLPAR